MLFCHRWLLLCFKREFPEAEALRIWEACWAHYQVSGASAATCECSGQPVLRQWGTPNLLPCGGVSSSPHPAAATTASQSQFSGPVPLASDLPSHVIEININCWLTCSLLPLSQPGQSQQPRMYVPCPHML